MIRPVDDAVIHLHRKPVDMIKSIDGLVSIVQGHMGLDPFSSQLFIFCNTKRNIIKMVYWEGNGFVLWMKRIEEARFRWPHDLPTDSIKLSAQQINWLLDGYGLTHIQGQGTGPHHTVL